MVCVAASLILNNWQIFRFKIQSQCIFILQKGWLWICLHILNWNAYRMTSLTEGKKYCDVYTLSLIFFYFFFNFNSSSTMIYWMTRNLVMFILFMTLFLFHWLAYYCYTIWMDAREKRNVTLFIFVIGASGLLFSSFNSIVTWHVIDSKLTIIVLWMCNAEWKAQVHSTCFKAECF